MQLRGGQKGGREEEEEEKGGGLGTRLSFDMLTCGLLRSPHQPTQKVIVELHLTTIQCQV